MRAEALAADARASRALAGGDRAGRRRASPSSSSSRFPLLAPGGVLVAWKRGDLDAELAAATRAIDALGGGPLEVASGRRSRASRATGWSSSTARGRVPAGLPARSRGAQAAAVVSGAAARLTADADRRPLGHPQQPRRARRRPRPRSASVDAVWHLGDVVGYGPEPDAVVERLAAVGAVGVRGNHDAAACGGREIDWFNPDARAAMEWTRDGDLRRDRGPGWPPCRSAGSSRRLHARPRQPARPDLGVRHVRRASPARAIAAMATRARPARPHPRPDRLRRGRTAGLRTIAPGPASTVELGRGRAAPQPGQRRPAARRRPAGQLPGPRHGRRRRRPGSASPTTSRPSGRRCARPACRRLAERLRVGL